MKIKLLLLTFPNPINTTSPKDDEGTLNCYEIIDKKIAQNKNEK